MFLPPLKIWCSGFHECIKTGPVFLVLQGERFFYQFKNLFPLRHKKMPVSNFFETSNDYPRYHSNCRIVQPLTGIYQFLCLNAAFTESVYSAFCLSGFRLRSDKSLEVCLRFSPATGSLCASFPDRLRHRLSSLHSSTRRGMCQSFF